jgi:hypothetical protein
MMVVIVRRVRITVGAEPVAAIGSAAATARSADGPTRHHDTHKHDD